MMTKEATDLDVSLDIWPEMPQYPFTIGKFTKKLSWTLDQNFG